MCHLVSSQYELNNFCTGGDVISLTICAMLFDGAEAKQNCDHLLDHKHIFETWSHLSKFDQQFYKESKTPAYEGIVSRIMYDQSCVKTLSSFILSYL